jgi:exodeoxyribonuclease VIII
MTPGEALGHVSRPHRTAPAPVRFSALKHIQRSPAHYAAIAESATDETISMRLGSAGHAILLEQPIAVYTGKVRRGKAWETFEEEHVGQVVVNQREHDEARRMVDSIMKHRDARQLIFSDDAAMEKRLEWSALGRSCAGTPDVRTGRYVVDLKTTRCSEPSKFNRDGTWRYYHAQLAWYLDGVVASGIGKPSEAYIVAVESTKPWPVTVLRLTDRALDQGRRLCRLWLERLLQCERANYWPGYVEGIVDFDVLDDPFELTIGGEKTLIESAPALGVIDPDDVDEMEAVF